MLKIRNLGLQLYDKIFNDMQKFTSLRTENTDDELWLLEHYPVYTQGQAGKNEHILTKSDIPIIQSDRGGQVTYHGPGQLVGYVLMDIKRKHLGIRTLVHKLEECIIQVLQFFKIPGETRCNAPGVYVNNKKIASIGLRVKNGCTYHGIALNVNMDIKPYLNINPCGFAKLEMTHMGDYVPNINIEEVSKKFIEVFLNNFGYLKDNKINYASF